MQARALSIFIFLSVADFARRSKVAQQNNEDETRARHLTTQKTQLWNSRRPILKRNSVDDLKRRPNPHHHNLDRNQVKAGIPSPPRFGSQRQRLQSWAKS